MAFNYQAQALHWYDVDGDTDAAQVQLFIDCVANAPNVVDEVFGTTMELWNTEFSPVPVHDAQVLSDFLAVAMP